MSRSVSEKITHRMPRPVRCDACGSPKVELQSKELMRMRVRGPWSLIWYCSDCTAWVGCHEGTDVPMGLMGDRNTRHARFEAHQAMDPLWRGRKAIAGRDEVYQWMAAHLGIDYSVAHISMLNEEQCNRLIAGLHLFRELKQVERGRVLHWKESTRKKRRK